MRNTSFNYCDITREIELPNGDMEIYEVKVEYDYMPGEPAVWYRKNGDPGDPGSPAEFEVTGHEVTEYTKIGADGTILVHQLKPGKEIDARFEALVVEYKLAEDIEETIGENHEERE